jgi:hypothetical protein
LRCTPEEIDVKRVLDIVLCAGAGVLLGCQDVPPTPPLATGQVDVTSLAADGAHVYWTTGDGHVRRVPADGGAVEQVATGSMSPRSLALDADTVYWASEAGEIFRAPKTGGTPELMFQEGQGLGDLQVDDTHLYWLRSGSSDSPGQVRKAEKALQTTPETLATGTLDPGTLTRAGAFLYYPAVGDGAGANELSTSGGTPVTEFAGVFHRLATNGAVLCSAGIDAQALAQDPTTTAQSITCAQPDASGLVTNSDGTVADGRSRIVASGLGFVTSMSVDDTNIYFTTDDGQFSVVGLDGSAPAGVTSIVTSSDGTTDTGSGVSGPAVIASGPAGGANVAVDLTSVYWAHSKGNAIFAAPRF